MRIGSARTFLVLRNGKKYPECDVELVPTYPDVLAKWNAGCRISPIWPLGKVKNGYSNILSGRKTIFFIGPVSPALFSQSIDLAVASAEVTMWATAGLFNLVCIVSAKGKGVVLADQIEKWAKMQQIAAERWEVHNGKLTAATPIVGKLQSLSTEIQKRLAKLSKQDVPSIIKHPLEEFLPLVAQAMARSESRLPSIASKIEGVLQIVEKACKETRENQEKANELHIWLLHLNAALSRLTSQTFAGSPPIQRTECHFWMHSLLGTGSANLALENLIDFFSERFSRERISERIALLKNVKTNVPDYKRLLNHQLAIPQDILTTVAPAEDESDPLTPIITYLSGRDGYNSQSITLSAPLTTVAEANCHRSSILTVTHEFSHIEVEAVLAELFEGAYNDRESQTLANSYSAKTFGNMFEAAQCLLTEALVRMDRQENSRNGNIGATLSVAQVRQLLFKWHKELKEIAVHTFDYLYFFNNNPAMYVESIWHTWCSIPGIGDRIPDYLQRTLCAASSKFLGEEVPTVFDRAVEITKLALDRVSSAQSDPNNYAATALNKLTTSSERQLNDPNSIYYRFCARYYVVKFVREFLYSPSVLARIYSEPSMKAGSQTGYRKTMMKYDNSIIDNPLRFVTQYTEEQPRETASLWLLHNLAFCVTRGQ